MMPLLSSQQQPAPASASPFSEPISQQHQPSKEVYLRERRRLTKEADAAHAGLEAIDLLSESSLFLFEEIQNLAWTTFTLTAFVFLLGIIANDGYMILLTWLMLPVDVLGLVVYHAHRKFGSGLVPKITLLNMYEVAAMVLSAVYAIVLVLRWTVYFSPSKALNWVTNLVLGMFFILALYKAIVAINLHQKRNKAYVDIAQLHMILEKEQQ